MFFSILYHKEGFASRFCLKSLDKGFVLCYNIISKTMEGSAMSEEKKKRGRPPLSPEMKAERIALKNASTNAYHKKMDMQLKKNIVKPILKNIEHTEKPQGGGHMNPNCVSQ